MGFAFSFSNNDCVILCVIWWGPVSISYSFRDIVGACVYKFFSPPNSIYKTSSCFDRVGGLYFTLFPNTNLPCGGIGAYVYIQVNNKIQMCALGNTKCGLGIRFCTIGPTLASVYSTLRIGYRAVSALYRIEAKPSLIKGWNRPIINLKRVCFWGRKISHVAQS